MPVELHTVWLGSSASFGMQWQQQEHQRFCKARSSSRDTAADFVRKMAGWLRLLLLLLLHILSKIAAAEAAAAPPELPSCGSTPSGSCLRQQAAALQEWGQEIRRQLHRHPELMYEEQQTSALVQQVLRSLGVKYTNGWGRDRRDALVDVSLLEASTLRGDGEELQKLQQQQRHHHQQLVAGHVGTGVVAEVGTGTSPCVLLRADMDALPILEKANVSFKSEVEGKMHACGHDAHTTMLLMAAAILKKNEAALKGTVRLVFQPAEEGGRGAAMMLAEGLLEKQPKPLLAFGLHVSPQHPTGVVASREGPLMAATASFSLEIVGLGGHGAMPVQTRDPIAACTAAAQSVNAIVARENDFSLLSSGLISITQIHAGSAYNVIPSKCTLGGTIRAFSTEKLRELQLRLRQVVQRTAEAYRCTLRVRRLLTDTPAVQVHPHALTILNKAVAAIGGGQVETIPPTTGGEDFSFVLERVPGAFAFLGIGSGEQRDGYVPTSRGLHHPEFAVDEEALQTGAAVHAQFAFEAIEDLLQQQQEGRRDDEL